MIASGCIISGAEVRSSLLICKVHVDERSQLEETVVLPEVTIGRGCRIRRAVIDKGCKLPDGLVIGYDPAQDSTRFHVTPRGIALVTAQMLRDLR
jgi:glucose-1-phosphate adenylyltransferase